MCTTAKHPITTTHSMTTSMKRKTERIKLMKEDTDTTGKARVRQRTNSQKDIHTNMAMKKDRKIKKIVIRMNLLLGMTTRVILEVTARGRKTRVT